MTLHSSTRTPVDDSYAALIGKAVYVFAYYELTIIYAIDYLRSGFVSKYCRGESMTSGTVRRELQDTINSPHVSFSKVSKSELQACCDEISEPDSQEKCFDSRPPCDRHGRITNPRLPNKGYEAVA